ncbi:MAG: DUF4367 domain-containing protein, partial [Tumebacillaceae bacterium]
YESKATMTVSVNNSTQKYYIETWYQSPDLYRISLGTDPKDITQVIVHNNDGIFVVSPQLKKSFRFKGDWAENQGHVYMYHAALDRILKSQNKQFDSTDKNLVFTMKMEPENPLVLSQRVTLKDNLDPQQIALLDKSGKSLVSVDYDSFKTGVSFKKDAFTPEAAMTVATAEAKPVMAGALDFGVIEPHYVPQGNKLLDPQTADGSIILHYAGNKPFTITEQRPAANTTSLHQGQIIDLWGSTAVLTGAADAAIHSLHWFNDGVEFSLTGSMTVNEMVKVAQSMIGAGK